MFRRQEIDELLPGVVEELGVEIEVRDVRWHFFF